MGIEGGKVKGGGGIEGIWPDILHFTPFSSALRKQLNNSCCNFSLTHVKKIRSQQSISVVHTFVL